jgi:uncharacterized protein YecA (UPF0149 family)
MTKFNLSSRIKNPAREKALKEELQRQFPNVTDEQIKEELENFLLFQNDCYTVTVRGFEKVEPYWHLSIKRNDKRPIHDWRDLQKIKNEIIGTENEGVEIYPAESRLVDSANQYHLWVFKDVNSQIPVGFFDTRFVTDVTNEEKTGVKQRKFDEPQILSPKQGLINAYVHDGEIITEKVEDDSSTNFFIDSSMIGRNDLCPCGSGKKYKHCHLKEVQNATMPVRVL